MKVVALGLRPEPTGPDVRRRQPIRGGRDLCPNETEIRPFRVDMPDEAIADLRPRIAATHWPSRELAALTTAQRFDSDRAAASSAGSRGPRSEAARSHQNGLS